MLRALATKQLIGGWVLTTLAALPLPSGSLHLPSELLRSPSELLLRQTELLS